MSKIEIPVTFFDGETEIDLGKVEITPNMTFKLLQFTLSNKIGISPNHITIYFDKLRYNHLRGRRRPVTSKFDFSSLSLEDSDVFFWVVLKRSRRSRRRGSRDYDAPPVLLRRGVNDWEYLEYLNRLRMASQLSLNLNSNIYDELLLSGYGFNPNYNNYNPNYNYNYQDNYNYNYNYNYSNGNHSDDYLEADVASSSGSSEKVYCEVCCNSSDNGETVPFHWCKNDVVTTGFRSLVGPIAPPKKNRFLG